MCPLYGYSQNREICMQWSYMILVHLPLLYPQEINAFRLCIPIVPSGSPRNPRSLILSPRLVKGPSLILPSERYQYLIGKDLTFRRILQRMGRITTCLAWRCGTALLVSVVLISSPSYVNVLMWEMKRL